MAHPTEVGPAALTLTLSQRARELRCRGGEQLWRIAVKNASRGRENEGEFGELVGGGSAPAAKSGPGHEVCAHMGIYGDGRGFARSSLTLRATRGLTARR